MKAIHYSFVLVLMTLGFGCAGEGRPADSPSPNTQASSCVAPPPPCGGNLEGDWRVIEDCVDRAVVPCNDVDQSLTEKPDRVFSFSDTSFGFWSIGAWQGSLSFARSCLDTGSCADASVASAGLRCTDSTADRCQCAVELRTDTGGSGSFSVADGNVTLVYDTDRTEIWSFCVQGSRLYAQSILGTAQVFERCPAAGCGQK